MAAGVGQRWYLLWPTGRQGSERDCLTLWVGFHQGHGKEFWLGTRRQDLICTPGVSEVLLDFRMVGWRSWSWKYTSQSLLSKGAWHQVDSLVLGS